MRISNRIMPSIQQTGITQLLLLDLTHKSVVIYYWITQITRTFSWLFPSPFIQLCFLPRSLFVWKRKLTKSKGWRANNSSVKFKFRVLSLTSCPSLRICCLNLLFFLNRTSCLMEINAQTCFIPNKKSKQTQQIKRRVDFAPDYLELIYWLILINHGWLGLCTRQMVKMESQRVRVAVFPLEQIIFLLFVYIHVPLVSPKFVWHVHCFCFIFLKFSLFLLFLYSSYFVRLFNFFMLLTATFYIFFFCFYFSVSGQ